MKRFLGSLKSTGREAAESLSLGLAMEGEKPEGKIAGFLFLLRIHLKKNWLVYSLLGALFYVVSLNYKLCINKSDSLNHSVFLVQKNLQPKVGQMVAFSVSGKLDFKPGTIFVKRVIGVEEGIVEFDGNSVFVNGSIAGSPKDKSSKGEKLDPIVIKGASERVPFNHLFVKGDHEKSFDSRYKQLGFIDRRSVVGTVVWSF